MLISENGLGLSTIVEDGGEKMSLKGASWERINASVCEHLNMVTLRFKHEEASTYFEEWSHRLDSPLNSTPNRVGVRVKIRLWCIPPLSPDSMIRSDQSLLAKAAPDDRLPRVSVNGIFNGS